MALRGPTRIQTRPLKRTGGASLGTTTMTAISQPLRFLFCTVIIGKGKILPLERKSEIVSNN